MSEIIRRRNGESCAAGSLALADRVRQMNELVMIERKRCAQIARSAWRQVSYLSKAACDDIANLIENDQSTVFPKRYSQTSQICDNGHPIGQRGCALCENLR